MTTTQTKYSHFSGLNVEKLTWVPWKVNRHKGDRVLMSLLERLQRAALLLSLYESMVRRGHLWGQSGSSPGTRRSNILLLDFPTSKIVVFLFLVSYPGYDILSQQFRWPKTLMWPVLGNQHGKHKYLEEKCNSKPPLVFLMHGYN